MSKKNEKKTFEYTVTSKLICGDCGKTIKEIIRVFDGDFELDLGETEVQRFLLTEAVNEFNGEEVNGDIFVIEIFDHQKHEMEVLGYIVEDDELEETR